MKIEFDEIKEHLHFLNVKVEQFEKELKRQENEQQQKIDWADTFILILGYEKTKGLTASFHPTEQHAIETMKNHDLNNAYKCLKIVNLKDLIK
jgi:hypothetical protein